MVTETSIDVNCLIASGNPMMKKEQTEERKEKKLTLLLCYLPFFLYFSSAHYYALVTSLESSDFSYLSTIAQSDELLFLDLDVSVAIR